MSAIRHTTGPWVVRTLDNFGFNVVHYINGDKFEIARVAKCSLEGNARFIVRACNSHYDLLEALKTAVNLYGQPGGPWNVPSEPGGWISLANSAIAKAEGHAE